MHETTGWPRFRYRRPNWAAWALIVGGLLAYGALTGCSSARYSPEAYADCVERFKPEAAATDYQTFELLHVNCAELARISARKVPNPR